MVRPGPTQVTFPVRLRNLLVSVEDPAGLMAVLTK
jgi:hypothetical protein